MNKSLIAATAAAVALIAAPAMAQDIEGYATLGATYIDLDGAAPPPSALAASTRPTSASKPKPRSAWTMMAPRAPASK